MLALVVAKGPLSCSKAWASALAGSRRPKLDPPGLRASATTQTAGSTKVTAPGQAQAAISNHSERGAMPRHANRASELAAIKIKGLSAERCFRRQSWLAWPGEAARAGKVSVGNRAAEP